MTATETISADGARLRVRPWRGQPDIAELTAWPPGALIAPSSVQVATERASAAGYRVVVTPALPRHEWRAYLDAGFELQEHLHLLAHDLLALPDAGPVRLRRAVRRDRDPVLGIDNRAFHPFWRLDGQALDDALRATPSTRFRVDRGGVLSGYAVVGRAGDRGYVQRLAVDPAGQGHGVGRALLADGLRWLRRWRVREALVNTQVDNHRALDLYERAGFRCRTDGLAVLRIDLAHGG